MCVDYKSSIFPHNPSCERSYTQMNFYYMFFCKKPHFSGTGSLWMLPFAQQLVQTFFFIMKIVDEMLVVTCSLDWIR